MKLKKLEELTIRDDFIFGKVFEDTELAKELISRILPELHLKDLKCVIRQRDLKDSYGTRGIRLDIYSENEEYLFGVEMHNNRWTFSPKRARYYKATTNMYLLEQGQDVDELKDLYIIIICTYDPFGHDKMIYRYENVCHETGEELKDGEHIVYVNCTAAENRETEIGRFCRYVMSGEVQDRFTENSRKAPGFRHGDIRRFHSCASAHLN